MRIKVKIRNKLQVKAIVYWTHFVILVQVIQPTTGIRELKKNTTRICNNGLKSRGTDHNSKYITIVLTISTWRHCFVNIETNSENGYCNEPTKSHESE